MMDRRDFFRIGFLAVLAQSCISREVVPCPVDLTVHEMIGASCLEKLGGRREAWQRIGRLKTKAPKAAGAFIRFCKQRHLEDLTLGQDVNVDGWILSATECVLYAWVFLTLQAGQ